MSRRPVRIALLGLAVLVLAVAAWGAVWWARYQYLLMWALAEKLGRRPDGSPATRPTTGPAGDRPKRDPNRIPSPEQMEKGMANFLAHQPPRTAAQMSELMNDMRKKREGLGIR